MKYLFTRPGYLTHEYISGRIQRYVSPLKMFLFTSLVLFFIMIKSDPNQYDAMVTESKADDDFIKEFILEEQNESGETDAVYKLNFDEQMNGNITLYIFAVMFIFSVLLAIVYFTKKIYYSEHIVFTLHFFTFVLWCFLLGVIGFMVSDFFLFFFMYFVPCIYLVIALKTVYHKTLWKALIVGCVLSFSYWILITIWVMGTIVISAIRA